MSRAPLILVLMIASAGPASALEEPYIWRDQESGCAYLLTQTGGITPRLRTERSQELAGAQGLQQHWLGGLVAEIQRLVPTPEVRNGCWLCEVKT
jgi:hypothetical protein